MFLFVEQIVKYTEWHQQGAQFDHYMMLEIVCSWGYTPDPAYSAQLTCPLASTSTLGLGRSPTSF